MCGTAVTEKKTASTKQMKKRTQAKEEPVIWDGTEAECDEENMSQSIYHYEWKIYTAEQLAGINNILGSVKLTGYNVEFKLMNDIYLNENSEEYLSWGNQPPKNKWTPIGNEKNSFQAAFNGNGYTIYGLYINTTENSQGLFGGADTLSGRITNLKLKNSYIKGGSMVGGIVGQSSRSLQISNCSVSKCVIKGEESSTDVGGIVGSTSSIWCTECQVKDCVISGGDNVGGIMGYCYCCEIADKLSMQGEISGNNKLGGICGYMGSSDSLNACYTLGKITGNRYVGGLFGYINSIRNSATDCSYTACELEGTESVGILFGYFAESDYISWRKYEISYPKECYENTGLYDIGETESGKSSANLFTDAAKPKEYFTNGRFCNENKELYGMILGQDEYPQFLNEENKVLKVQF